MQNPREKLFFLLEKNFPAFSKKNFLQASLIEKAQWLYLLVHQARFELISHFIFQPYSDYLKSGEEFIAGLEIGQGGVCLERVMGLKYLLDLFDIGECHYAMGGSLPVCHEPIKIEEVSDNLATAKQTKKLSPYAHHAAIILKIQGQEWLLDANGGRLGKIFLNPTLTEHILTEDTEYKLGISASFGQMFYHRVPQSLFEQLVEFRRGNAFDALDLICLVGLIVGENFDIFVIPENELERRLPLLYCHRVQTTCWEINDDFPATLSKYGMNFNSLHKQDLFWKKIHTGPTILNELSLKAYNSPLKIILRIAEKPWEQYTEVSPLINQAFMMQMRPTKNAIDQANTSKSKN